MSETSFILSEAEIDRHIHGLCKPPGSLGRWEAAAKRLCWIQQTLRPSVKPAELIIFAADHGVVEEGITLWPTSVTTCMVETIAQGRSASAALSAEYGIDWRVVDVGCKIPPRIEHPRLVRAAVGPGTNNLARGPAMSAAQFEQAMSVGAEQARGAVARGAKSLIIGEMGIGNTTAAACLAAWLADLPIDSAVGSGAGATEASLRKKREVVAEALRRMERLSKTRMSPSSVEQLSSIVPKASLGSSELPTVGYSQNWNNWGQLFYHEICGFEIAAMAGCMLEAARSKITILLDGMICTSAALIAHSIDPKVVDSMIAGHQSAEPSHCLMLERLGLKPMLEWEMRLGEGTGALAAYPLLMGACAWLSTMARIDELSLPEEK